MKFIGTSDSGKRPELERLQVCSALLVELPHGGDLQQRKWAGTGRTRVYICKHCKTLRTRAAEFAGPPDTPPISIQIVS
nr:hypothetical protein CFP56_10416 [Quercus suber]